MVRKFIVVLVGLLVLGNVVAPSAFAGHETGPKKGKAGGPHEDPPTNLQVVLPESVCTVTGSVGTAPGVPIIGASHNHYTFVDTGITCISVLGGPAGDFDVTAMGGTDGPPTVRNLDEIVVGSDVVRHGEWGLLGWSHSSGYPGSNLACDGKKNLPNKGYIAVSGVDSGDGWVKFIRLGPVVHAWGCLDLALNGLKFFNAELLFEADPPNTETLKFETAALTGVAVVGDKVIGGN